MLPDTMTKPDEASNVLIETPDFAEFKARMYNKTGIDLNLYKQPQMHRRLMGMVERVGKKDFLEYYTYLEQNTGEYAALMDRITINVSELFRNPEKWKELREKIMPASIDQNRCMNIWSAGCSYGAEPYSLAITMDQAAPSKPYKLIASDLDRSILKRAQEGRFTQADVKHIDKQLLDKYFDYTYVKGALPDLDACYQVKDYIRGKAQFQQHNLLADKFEHGFDLICCRNVVIYFTEPAKEALYSRFHQALRPGGVLFVGGAERILNYQKLGFDMPIPFFYRRKLE